MVSELLELVPVGGGGAVAAGGVRPHELVAIYLATLRTDSGRRAMESALRELARWLGAGNPHLVHWPGIGAAGVAALLARIQHHPNWQPANKARHEAALLGIMRTAYRAGVLDADTLQRCQSHPRTKVKRRAGHHATGRQLSHDELNRLARAAATLSAHATVRRRDRAFVALLVGCGLRREECLTLEMPDDGALPAHLAVRGKGGKERDVFAPGWVARELAAWVELRGKWHGPMLAPITRHGRVRVGAQWSTAAASRRFCELAAAAGVECTPHDTRRTFITAELARGTDVVLVARAVGHASPATTAGYDRRGLVALEELAAHQPALEGFDGLP